MDIKVSSANIRKWSMLGQRGAVFAVAMPALAEEMDSLKLVTADLSLLSGMDRYIKAYPDKFLNVGIAEQNMIGIAAGLAMAGKTVFATTYASFIAVRSLEHVRQHLSYLGCNVKLIGSSGGVVAAKSGVSHWATEDIAFTRVLPNMEVFSPADSLEAIKITEYAAHSGKPTYIRLSGALNAPIVYKEDYEFVPGKMVEVYHSDDAATSRDSQAVGDASKDDMAQAVPGAKKIAVIATGLMVSRAISAAKVIKEKRGHIVCDVYNMHTIKPLDKEGLDKIFEDYDLIFTVEEHNVLGGMGSAVAEYKATKAAAPRQVFIGFNDSFYPAGSQDYVLEEAGLSIDGIAESILKELD